MTLRVDDGGCSVVSKPDRPLGDLTSERLHHEMQGRRLMSDLSHNLMCWTPAREH